MSSAVAVGYGIDVGTFALKDVFAKTGGNLPSGSDLVESLNWVADRATQVIAVFDRFVI